MRHTPPWQGWWGWGIVYCLADRVICWAACYVADRGVYRASVSWNFLLVRIHLLGWDGVGGAFLAVWLTGSYNELVVLGLTGASVELLLAEIAFL